MLFSEVGRDMSRWPTAAHFVSCLGLCPDNDISGGKVLWRAIFRHLLFVGIHSGLEGRYQLFDFFVALIDQVAMASIQRQPLFEGQDVFTSPV